MTPRIVMTLAAAAAALALAACGRKPAAPPASGDFHAQVWVLPAEAGSMAPDLVRAPQTAAQPTVQVASATPTQTLGAPPARARAYCRQR